MIVLLHSFKNCVKNVCIVWLIYSAGMANERKVDCILFKYDNF